jgi:hypothetical protein
MEGRISESLGEFCGSIPHEDRVRQIGVRDEAKNAGRHR